MTFVLVAKVGRAGRISTRTDYHTTPVHRFKITPHSDYPTVSGYPPRAQITLKTDHHIITFSFIHKH